MVNRKRNMISIALSTALVVSVLVTGSTVYAQSKTTVSAPAQSDTNQTSLELAKTAGDKKVEVVKA
ncbi:hypothetical protein [Paenibacillus faecalis]|uniref:hypothetical protein n=1 Tax=Paenibacillus faecalis TaxID=2079532 RepID=UPI000D0F79AF|nr:hypothetical protein [Paenibacillus faecalis]